jgi:hypothetical protein
MDTPVNAGAMEPPCRTTAMLDTDVLAATTEHVHWMVHGWGMPLFANVHAHVHHPQVVDTSMDAQELQWT